MPGGVVSRSETKNLSRIHNDEDYRRKEKSHHLHARVGGGHYSCAMTPGIMEMAAPYDDDLEAYVVPDVGYCIDYAYNWLYGTSDFYVELAEYEEGELSREEQYLDVTL